MLTQILSEKTLLVIITLIGMAMCTVGIGQVAARNEWLNPMAIVAYIVGALILLIVGANLFNFSLPLINSTRVAMLAVIALAVLKVVISQLHRALA